MTLKEYAVIIERELDRIMPEAEERLPQEDSVPWLLENAMRYSLMAGGKRLRPAMLLACADMLGADRDEALPHACALEMIHTMSLIHDDLPGMDNDTLRRGRPTNHVVFGEGQAILAGDTLLCRAVEIMTRAALDYPAHETRHLNAMRRIMAGASAAGMMGGQSMDLYSERNRIKDESLLRYIHLNKTARMLTSPLTAAAALAGLPDDDCRTLALERFGRSFGLLFQVTDDILDVVSDSTLLGKSVGKDEASGKLTYMTLYGLDRARGFADDLVKSAIQSLDIFGDQAAFFRVLTEDMAARRG